MLNFKALTNNYNSEKNINLRFCISINSKLSQKWYSINFSRRIILLWQNHSFTRLTSYQVSQQSLQIHLRTELTPFGICNKTFGPYQPWKVHIQPLDTFLSQSAKSTVQLRTFSPGSALFITQPVVEF